MAPAKAQQEVQPNVIRIYTMDGVEVFSHQAETCPRSFVLRGFRDIGHSVLNFRLVCKDGTIKIGVKLSCNESPYTIVQQKNISET